MPAAAEIQAATLEKFIGGWKGWTPDGFLASWSDDCTQKTLPFSSGIGIRTKQDTKHLFPILMSIMSNYELKIHNVVHDASQGKAVIYAVSRADTPFGPYTNEHALFLWFDEAGERVQKIEEMFDAVTMKEFLPKLDKYVASQETQAEAQGEKAPIFNVAA